MRIHYILMLYLCSGILFLAYSFPIHRYIEDEDVNDIGLEQKKSNSRTMMMMKSNRKNKPEEINKNSLDNFNEKEKEVFLNNFESNSLNDEKIELILDINNRERSYTSNNNFYSKYSMNMDRAVNRGSRKNIMISIKANPVQEKYYNNPRHNSSNKDDKKWYNKVYKFFKNTYKKTKDNVIDKVYDSVKTGANKIVREDIDGSQNFESFFGNEDYFTYEDDDSDENEQEFSFLHIVDNNIIDHKLNKRDLQNVNNYNDIKNDINNWCDKIAHQFREIYDSISVYTNEHITPFFQAGKKKYNKLKDDFKSWKSFFDKIKTMEVKANENLYNTIPFFRMDKRHLSNVRTKDGDEQEQNNNNSNNNNKNYNNEKDNNDSFFSFFRNDRVKKRNKRSFNGLNNNKNIHNYNLDKIFRQNKNKNETVPLFQNKFNISELEANEIIDIKEKSEPLYWSVSSILFRILDFSSLSFPLEPTNKLSKRSNDNLPIRRYLRKKDFDFDATELVKGSNEWSNYYSYVEKMRSDELNYFKSLENTNSQNSRLRGVSEVLGNSFIKGNDKIKNETVHNKGRNGYESITENNEILNEQNDDDVQYKGVEEKERDNSKKKQKTKPFEKDEKVYLLDYNTLRNGFPQYSIKRQSDRFRSNNLLTELDNFDSDEIFHHLTSKNKYSLTVNKRYYWYTDKELAKEIYSELVTSEDDETDDDSTSSTISRKKDLKKREIIQKLKKRDLLINNLKKSHKKSQNNKIRMSENNDNEDINMPSKLTGRVRANRLKKLEDKMDTKNSTHYNPEKFDDDDNEEDNIVESVEEVQDEEEEDDDVNMIKIDFVCNIEHFSEKICNKTKNVINKAGKRLSSIIDFPTTVNIKVTFSSYCKEFNECKTTTLGSSSPSYFYEFAKDFDIKRKKNKDDPLYYTDNEFKIDTNFSYPGSLAKQRGPLNKGFIYDISLWLNGDWNWYYGRDQENDNIQPKQYDLEQVVIHEYLHGFGFVSSWYNWITNNDQNILVPSWLSWNTKKGGYHGLNKPYIYNKYLADVRDNKWLLEYQNAIINDFTNYPVYDSYTKVVSHFYNSIAYNYAKKIFEIFTTPESVVFWCKKPVNNAKPHWVVLYTNKKYKSGSTISHLDSSRYLKTSGFLMRPSGVRNVLLDEYKYNIKNHNGIGDDILCILGTLGYRIKYDPSELLEDVIEPDTTNKTNDSNKNNKNEENKNEDSEDIDEDIDIYDENIGITNGINKKISSNPNTTNKSKKLDVPNTENSNNHNNNKNNDNKNINRNENNNNNNNDNKNSNVNTETIVNKITTKKTINPTTTITQTTSTTTYEKKFKFKTINPIFKQQSQ